MKEYLLTVGITLALKTVIDLGVKYSKSTENTVDDLIFRNLQLTFNKISKFLTKKK